MNKVLPLSSITIPPRARIDYGDIPALARSIISTKGIHKGNDLIVELRDDGGYYLLGGGRRYEAYKLILNKSKEVWDNPPTDDDLTPFLEVPCKIHTNLTLADRIQIEYLENCERKDFSWQEKSSLVKAYHEVMQSQYGVAKPGRTKTGWSTMDTARELGLNGSDVVYYLKLHKGMQIDPTLKDVKQRSKALTKIKRTNRSAVADILDVTDHAIAGIHIQCGDSRDILSMLEPNIKFNMVITDPPWGIGFEERISEIRKESLATTYDKDYDVMDTLDVLMKCYERLQDNCPIYMFYSAFPHKVQEGQKLLISAGFNIEPIPLIWYKKHILAHDARETRHNLNYESILYGWKGERPLLNQPSRNILEHQIAFAGRIHASEKPEALLAEIILLHTKEGDMVCDPFGGSCKVADACKSTKRKCLVVELDDGLVKMASLRIRGI